MRQVICSDTISITGKAQQTHAAMSAEEAMDYRKVNTVIHYNSVTKRIAKGSGWQGRRMERHSVRLGFMTW